jgi:hypothetical protein
LHKDDPDPELMFQDCEYIPRNWYDESYIHEEFWDVLALDEYEQTKLMVYYEATGYDIEQCLSGYEDCYYFEVSEAEHNFDELFYDSAKAANDCSYLTKDIDGWLNDNYTEVRVDDTDYYVSIN